MINDELLVWYRKRAKEIWSSPEIEIDEFATVSTANQAGEGAFVAAWVWVDAPEDADEGDDLLNEDEPSLVS